MVDMSGLSAIGGIRMPSPATVGGAASTGNASSDIFGRMLSDAANTLNGLQQNADAQAEALATGQPVEIHDVMIAQEQNSLAFQFALQVRNKVVEAYQDVMRMQV